MARSTTPSSPDQLFPAPFIEVPIKLSEVENYYKHGVTTHGTQQAIPFATLATILTHFGKGMRLVSGSAEQLGRVITLINKNEMIEAYEVFSGMGEFDLTFPWVTPWHDTQSGKWLQILNVHGQQTYGQILSVMQANCTALMHGQWLVQGQATTRLTVNIVPCAGAAPVRVTYKSVDIWYPHLEQGVRFDCGTVALLDLSDGPMSLESINTLSPNNIGYYCGGTFVPLRSMSAKMTLAQNLKFNAALSYIGHRFSDVSRFPDQKDKFFSGVRSNLPIGAFLGNTVLAPSLTSIPVIGVHDTPNELYQTLRLKLPEGRKMRQGGIHAAPSSTARVSGTAANLELVGRTTQTSKSRKRAGYLLYDRESAETIKEALDVGEAAFAGHDLFTDYLEWYHEMRLSASRIRLRMGDPPVKWGKWGFKPFQFAGVQANAQLFIKILPEDA